MAKDKTPPPTPDKDKAAPDKIDPDLAKDIERFRDKPDLSDRVWKEKRRRDD